MWRCVVGRLVVGAFGCDPFASCYLASVENVSHAEKFALAGVGVGVAWLCVGVAWCAVVGAWLCVGFGFHWSRPDRKTAFAFLHAVALALPLGERSPGAAGGLLAVDLC